MNGTPSPLAMAAEGLAPEVSVSRDIIKKGLWVAPIVMGLGAIIWGANGAWSAGLGLAIVLINFGLAAPPSHSLS